MAAYARLTETGYNLATATDLDYKTFPARVGSSIGRAAPKVFGVGSELKKSCDHSKLGFTGR